MNRFVFARALAAAGVAAGLGIAGAGSGFAATTSTPSASPQPSLTLAQLKAKCDDAVQRRLTTLAADLSFVNQSSALTADDRQNLQGQITGDQSGLKQLDATIQQDTTFAQAKADCAKIVTGFRVYVLEDPKIHEVIAADGLGKVDAAFEVLIPKLRDLIENSSQPPNVKQQAEAVLSDLRNKVSASETSISGVSASVINLQPSGYPGNAVVLKSAAQNIHTSREDLDGARADVNTILHLLGG
ncbi:MAG TPA: hypothetical protein VEY89_09395 [Candidatus Dormibacteraeota bacterium]|nr:hypothetical protein [Candidatus Dormibacteraeota bacterium]